MRKFSLKIVVFDKGATDDYAQNEKE